MNNICPGCGLEYAVTPADVGRRIRCKKCSTPLAITDAGLVPDTPPVPPPVPSSPPAGAESPAIPWTPTAAPSTPSTGPSFADWVAQAGGTPTVLFGIGTFLVVLFFFQPYLSTASLNRAEGAYERVEFDRDLEIRKVKEARNVEEMTPEQRADYEKDAAKKEAEINRKYRKSLAEASDDKKLAGISAKRSPWLDQYGLMFGFLFLAFGCIGYVRNDGPLVVRIVGGVILILLLLAIFAKFSGCRGP